MSPQDPSNAAPIGTIIAGKYRVERVVGKGGMGVVVAARHIKLDEPFAIKMMLAEDLGNAASIERFLREAKASVKLKNNEHIARVTDVDTLPNGLPYMVMELLDGHDLDKLLKDRGVFPFHEACSYVVQACSALADAHKLGIIHRDLKPQNLFLTHRKDGSPCIKVLDFGISKHTLTDDSLNIDLTRPCDVLGSAYYMSPEQARSSRSVVPQSDIWSIGAVLYKLLTGRAPFPKKTLLDVYRALFEEPVVRPSLFRGDMPAELEEIILRCLDKNFAGRYSSARELMSALAPFTVPGETTTSDDSDSATTLPMVRPPKLPGLGGTLPLAEVQASKKYVNGASNDEHRGLQFKTQPLDARSLHAALHAYLPARPMPRPPAPSHPSLPNTFDVAGDDPTPRIVLRDPLSVKPAPLPDESQPHRRMPRFADALPSSRNPAIPAPAPIPQLGAMKSPDLHGTIHASARTAAPLLSGPLIRNRLPSEKPAPTMAPLVFEPAGPAKSMSRTRMLLFAAAGTIIVILLLLFLRFFGAHPRDTPPNHAASIPPEVTPAHASTAPILPRSDINDAGADKPAAKATPRPSAPAGASKSPALAHSRNKPAPAQVAKEVVNPYLVRDVRR